MKSLWNDREAQKLGQDLLALRVYTSQLLGKEPNLVLHGGGNTSVKGVARDLFGQEEEILYIKGSGWDLQTIEAAGFAPVRLDALRQMAEHDVLADSEMVKLQRAAMIDPYAPNPSVEAILHAIIPFRFVDHTHADAVVTVTNTENGRDRIREIYGEGVFIVPYVMPGFLLAREVYRMTLDLDWLNCAAIVLMSHGVFTFDDDAKVSYEKMIDITTEAENYLQKKHAVVVPVQATVVPNLPELASIRKEVSAQCGSPLLAQLNTSDDFVDFSNQGNVASIADRGPLTPDYVIRTKRTPVILIGEADQAVRDYARSYKAYFDRHADRDIICLDPAPRWAVWPKCGTISFGQTARDLKITTDITRHTVQAITSAEKLGGWKALPEKDIFDVEYWELEQLKLKKGSKPPLFAGKIALVTGAANGIGKACVEALRTRGAVVAAIDLDPKIRTVFDSDSILGMACDVTNETQVTQCLDELVRRFGGLDIVVSNAGIFPDSRKVAEMDPDIWEKSIDVNLTSHQRVLKVCIPYLRLGVDPAIVIIASKNVPAPGPGAAAYSVAKAGLTQLARIIALEEGAAGIRVNTMHPNAVYDTQLWTDEILKKRAEHYGMTVQAYKTNNVLRTEVSSRDVAELACTMAGPAFAKTTGAQIPIDGGNERVI